MKFVWIGFAALSLVSCRTRHFSEATPVTLNGPTLGHVEGTHYALTFERRYSLAITKLDSKTAKIDVYERLAPQNETSPTELFATFPDCKLSPAFNIPKTDLITCERAKILKPNLYRPVSLRIENSNYLAHENDGKSENVFFNPREPGTGLRLIGRTATDEVADIFASRCTTSGDITRCVAMPSALQQRSFNVKVNVDRTGRKVTAKVFNSNGAVLEVAKECSGVEYPHARGESFDYTCVFRDMEIQGKAYEHAIAKPNNSHAEIDFYKVGQPFFPRVFVPNCFYNVKESDVKKDLYTIECLQK